MKSFIGIEEWRDIAGYEGYYQVSNFGKVRSVGRYVKCKGSNYIEGRIMKPNMDKYGYFKILLCKNNKYKTFTIHRLVAETFKPNPHNYPTVDHINRIKTDNRADNLRWAPWELQAKNRKERVQLNQKSTSKPVEQYTKDMVFVAEYPSVSEASRKTGINKSNISSCCNGNPEHKTAGGYIWKYV